MGNNVNDNINQNAINNDINNLKIELSKAYEIIEQQKSTINNLQNKLNNFNSTINNYQTQINNLKSDITKKDLELNNLRNQLNNNNLNKDIASNQKMYVNFILMDKNVFYPVPCIKTDIFADIEEKLYQKFPKYRETNNNFIANGATVLRFKTIAENKIGKGIPVSLVVPS